MRSFETERLRVRDWTPDIADPARRQALQAALEELLTERVLRHLPPPLRLSDGAEEIGPWIEARAAESDVGLVLERDTDRLVGLLILAFMTGEAETAVCHLGYLFAETAWGRGYATELVTGLAATLDREHPVMLAGGVGRDNPASARVLQKAGFTKDPELSDAETEIYLRRPG
ncbi:GNAT family N-acetyltransferase [Limimaricola pyoseonensis]|uniref:Protein N-acetyltransferase, RimJ/RimL family n=1 Tax=Limimaricola pyoseonensis TaxID=521013 RepID=A0A1G7JTQ9_9RHOB|nr:GNAT family N-acetyltransferase [Limimaricola pyoseonensis]SDF28312.1 Protein N-acetyltransferase, RimJ/RimL family [Limimaricola pyoseonensis]